MESKLFLETWFPTIIGHTYCPFHDRIENSLTEHCLKLQNSVSSGGEGWISNKTYNTSDGKHDCLDDPVFDELSAWVDFAVKQYVEANKIHPNIKINSSWFNVYKKYDYQEFHKHPGSVISTIYFLKADKNSSRVIFKTPNDDMFQMSYTENTPAMLKNVYYSPDPGKLIIFPSNISHAVERQEVDSQRITLSYNFVQE